jgi:hypothetical protein
VHLPLDRREFAMQAVLAMHGLATARAAKLGEPFLEPIKDRQFLRS